MNGHKIADERIGFGLAMLAGAPPKNREMLGQHLHPVLELVKQARFAHASLPGDGHHLALAILHGMAQRFLEEFQLCVAGDHTGLDAFHALRAQPEYPGFGLLDQVHLYRLSLALDRYWVQDLYLKEPPHMAIGVVRDHDPACRRSLLHARCQVHGVSHGGILGP